MERVWGEGGARGERGGGSRQEGLQLQHNHSPITQIITFLAGSVDLADYSNFVAEED